MRSLWATVVLLALLWHATASAQHRRRRPTPQPTPPTPAVAPAEVEDAAARGRFDAGLAYYEAGRFEEALTEFRAAWELSHRPEMLINVANAAERALEFGVAIEHLRLYLERVPDAPDREVIERRIARDESTLARAGASRTPPAGGVGNSDETAGGGAPVAAIISLGAAGALAIGAVVTGLVAHGKYNDLTAGCPDGLCPAALGDDLDSGETMALVSTVLTGLAVVAGGLGLILLVVDGGDEDAPATRARLELALGTPLAALSSSMTFRPTAVSLASYAATGIVAASSNVCILTGGNARCWGDDSYEELALGAASTGDRADSVDVGSAAKITIGYIHMCAIEPGGAMRCWGGGSYGQLGDGNTASTSSPVTVAGGDSAIDIAAGDTFTCGLVDEPTGADSVYCWGNNESSQLGVATPDSIPLPTRVGGIPDVPIAITAGTDHVCVLTSLHDVYCWGSNFYLQLGPGATPFADRAEPIRVSGLD